MGWRKFSTTYPFQTPGHTLTRVTLVNPVRGMVVTSCLLTRKRRLREVKWLLQGHTARSGFEPRTLIPKLFPFHDLCWCCRVAVSPVRTPTASGRGAFQGCTWGQWSPFRGCKTTWSGPSFSLLQRHWLPHFSVTSSGMLLPRGLPAGTYPAVSPQDVCIYFSYYKRIAPAAGSRADLVAKGGKGVLE